jgi:hypothetical protein
MEARPEMQNGVREIEACLQDLAEVRDELRRALDRLDSGLDEARRLLERTRIRPVGRTRHAMPSVGPRHPRALARGPEPWSTPGDVAETDDW